MVFQIVTNDKRILTVHTEVGNGVTKVVIDESEPEPEPETPKAKDETE